MMASRAFALACHPGEKSAKEGLKPAGCTIDPVLLVSIAQAIRPIGPTGALRPLSADGRELGTAPSMITKEKCSIRMFFFRDHGTPEQKPLADGSLLAVIRSGVFIVRDKAPESVANPAR
jgi:hypothetical protein